jgi:hypothetical protein
MYVTDRRNIVKGLAIEELEEARDRLRLVKKKHVHVQSPKIKSSIEFPGVEMKVATVQPRQKRKSDG